MREPKEEGRLKAEFLIELDAPHFQLFVTTHQDVRKRGIPDLAVHGAGRTTWWEFKHATPNFKSQGIQEVQCRKLAQYSFCRYIIYCNHDGTRATWIVHPKEVYRNRGRTSCIVPEIVFMGHNHLAVAEYVRAKHR